MCVFLFVDTVGRFTLVGLYFITCFPIIQTLEFLKAHIPHFFHSVVSLAHYSITVKMFPPFFFLASLLLSFLLCPLVHIGSSISYNIFFKKLFHVDLVTSTGEHRSYNHVSAYSSLARREQHYD